MCLSPSFPQLVCQQEVSLVSLLSPGSSRKQTVPGQLQYMCTYRFTMIITCYVSIHDQSLPPHRKKPCDNEKEITAIKQQPFYSSLHQFTLMRSLKVSV